MLPSLKSDSPYVNIITDIHSQYSGFNKDFKKYTKYMEALDDLTNNILVLSPECEKILNIHKS